MSVMAVPILPSKGTILRDPLPGEKAEQSTVVPVSLLQLMFLDRLLAGLRAVCTFER